MRERDIWQMSNKNSTSPFSFFLFWWNVTHKFEPFARHWEIYFQKVEMAEIYKVLQTCYISAETPFNGLNPSRGGCLDSVR